MYFLNSQSHLVCEDTMLVIPPVLEEPFQPINLVKPLTSSVLQNTEQRTNLERHELEV